MSDCISCPTAIEGNKAEMCSSCIERHTKRGLAQQREQILEMIEKLSLHPNNGGIAIPQSTTAKDQESFEVGWRKSLLTFQETMKKRVSGL